MFICILGRQPRLSLAELEATYGAGPITLIGEVGALVDAPAQDMHRAQLGGTMKIAELITTVHTAKWNPVASECLKSLPSHLLERASGKLTLGFSVYGFKASAGQVNALALALKKQLRSDKQSIRVVPNRDVALDSAQVWHNHLADAGNAEVILITDGSKTYIGRTISVQDIERYSERDFGRPRRDARVGMLPPKLAQIMLNLSQAKAGQTVLDPFCGTGVVLMEATLMGLGVMGSDLEPRMIAYTRENLVWLEQRFAVQAQVKELAEADATRNTWHEHFDTVVCETYLGRPLAALPDSDTLRKIVNDCNSIIRAFLQNLSPQLAPGNRCCLAVPAWRTPQGFWRLPLIDELGKLGYNLVSFKHARREDLFYHRPDQIVARELLVLQRS